MNTYQKWIQSEKDWINIYCGKIRRQTLGITAPFVIIVLALVYGGLAAVDGESMEEILTRGFYGGMFGAVICVIFLAVLLPMLSPRRYTEKIEKNVRELSLNEIEKEQLMELLKETDLQIREDEVSV